MNTLIELFHTPIIREGIELIGSGLLIYFLPHNLVKPIKDIIIFLAETRYGISSKKENKK